VSRYEHPAYGLRVTVPPDGGPHPRHQLRRSPSVSSDGGTAAHGADSSSPHRGRRRLWVALAVAGWAPWALLVAVAVVRIVSNQP